MAGGGGYGGLGGGGFGNQVGYMPGNSNYYTGGTPLMGGGGYDPTKNPTYRAMGTNGGFGTANWQTSHPGFSDKWQQAGAGGFTLNPTFRSTSQDAGGFGTQAWQAAHPQFDDRWKQVVGGFVQKPQPNLSQFYKPQSAGNNKTGGTGGLYG